MLMLALLVSTAVFWRLKYVGIAMTNEVFCGLEEHTHTDECYENVLVCGYEEGEEVYPDDETLSGEALTPEIHVHTDSCYERVLICGMEEHTHTVDCLIDHSLDDPTETAGLETAETETTSEGETADSETEISSDEPRASSGEGSDTSGGSEVSDYDEGVYDALPDLTGYALTDFILTAQSQIGYRESKTDYIVSEEENCRKGYMI